MSQFSACAAKGACVRVRWCVCASAANLEDFGGVLDGDGALEGLLEGLEGVEVEHGVVEGEEVEQAARDVADGVCGQVRQDCVQQTQSVECGTLVFIIGTRPAKNLYCACVVSCRVRR